MLGSWNLYAGQLCSLPASVSSLQPSLHHPAEFTFLDDDEEEEDGDGEPGDEDDLNEDDGDYDDEEDDE